jgi:DNA uptake protein ComE-like DNA-binding protein
MRESVENEGVRVNGLARAGAAVILCAGLCWGAYATPVAVPVEQRVDINHASLDDLLKIPGLSRVWAARIVRFRPYRTKEDLVDKGVVSSAVYDKIKDFVIARRDKAASKEGLRVR